MSYPIIIKKYNFSIKTSEGKEYEDFDKIEIFDINNKLIISETNVDYEDGSGFAIDRFIKKLVNMGIFLIKETKYYEAPL